MALRPLAPEASASANSATSAYRTFDCRQDSSLYHHARLTGADQRRDHEIATDIHRGPAHIQEPVDPQNEPHPFGWDAHRLPDDHHHRQRTARDAGGADPRQE